MILFYFNEYQNLAQRILRENKKIKKGRFYFKRFANQELFIKLNENVKNKNCLILATIIPPEENLFKLLLLAHTLKKEGARKIFAIIPYLSYLRQDKNKKKESWAAKWLSLEMKCLGIQKVFTLVPHSNFAVRNFEIPLINIFSFSIFKKVFRNKNFKIIAPDKGALDLANSFRDTYGIEKPISYFKKIRKPQKVVFKKFYGKTEKEVLIIDDILDTGETLIKCIKLLKKRNVKKINILVVHGLFTGEKWKNIFKLGVEKIFVSDSYPFLRERTRRFRKNIKIFSIIPVINNFLRKEINL